MWTSQVPISIQKLVLGLRSVTRTTVDDIKKNGTLLAAIKDTHFDVVKSDKNLSKFSVLLITYNDVIEAN